MKRLLTSVLALSFSLTGSTAYAQETVGGRLKELIGSLTGPALFLVSILCFAGGLWLLIRGLVRLKDSSGNNEQTGAALLTIVAAVFLIALPEVAGVGMVTAAGGGLFNNSDLAAAKGTLDANYASGSDGVSQRLSEMAQVTAPSNCFESKEPVPCMAKNISINVVPIGVIAVFVAVFIAGIWGFGSALFELTKLQPGQRGLPQGWWGRLIFSVLLMNGPVLFTMFTQTILGESGTVVGSGLVDGGSSLLKYSAGAGDKFKQYEDLIGYCFTILALFGAIAFVRGIFVMKNAGEGKQGGSYGHGIVFMVAGVLLANAKSTTCTLMTTVGMTANDTGLGFCS